MSKANMDSVFDGVNETELDFDTIFDQEDSLIDTVNGVNEAGDPLTGRDPEECCPTDEGTGKKESPEGTEKDPKTTYNTDNEGMKSGIPNSSKSDESEAHETKDLEFSDEAALEEADDSSDDKDAPDGAESQEEYDKDQAEQAKAEKQNESVDLDTLFESDDEDNDTEDDGADSSEDECTKESVDESKKEAPDKSEDECADESVDLDTLFESDDEDDDTEDDGADSSEDECTKEDAGLDVTLGSPETKPCGNSLAADVLDIAAGETPTNPAGTNVNGAEGSASGEEMQDQLGNPEDGVDKSQAPGDSEGIDDSPEVDQEAAISNGWRHSHALDEAKKIDKDVAEVGAEDKNTNDADVDETDKPDPKGSKLNYEPGVDDELIDIVSGDDE